MNKIFYIFLFLFLIPNLLWAADSQIPALESKAPIPFVPPKIDTHEFENGLKIYYIENKELPVFEVSALVDAGSIYEPADKQGLGSMMLAGLRTGGTSSRSSEQIDAEIERLAAHMGIRIDPEFAEISVKGLIQDVDPLLKTFFEIIQTPAFDAKKIEIARQKILQDINQRNEKPAGIAYREFAQLLYGNEDIWSRTPGAKDIESITRDDILKFYSSHVAPNNMRLAVSAHMSFEEFKKKLLPYFAQWLPKTLQKHSLKVRDKKWKGSTNLIVKEANQSSVVVGHFGDHRFSPDKYSLILANTILGASTFGSRLGSKIRTELGLAYSINSSYGLSTDLGLFQVSAGTKTESTKLVIDEIRNILKEMASSKPITAQELENAKNILLNQIIFEYSELQKIVEARRYYDYYGYPPNYLEIYPEEIKKVTLEQVNEAVKRNFFPDQLVVLIVGSKNIVSQFAADEKVNVLPLDNE